MRRAHSVVPIKRVYTPIYFEENVASVCLHSTLNAYFELMSKG